MAPTYVLLATTILIGNSLSLPLKDTSAKQPHYKCKTCSNDSNDQMENQPLTKQPWKKDMFISRGWGAGGMPFNVFYTNPTSAKMADDLIQPIALTSSKPKSSAQPRMSTSKTKSKSSRSSSSSAVPQLFISYGWGPLGRK